MRIVFLGTAEFAIPTLEALIRAGHQVLAVYTRPDRPAGRGLRLSLSPVKEKSLSLGLEVFQPETLKQGQEIERFQALSLEAAVVVAYGMKLPTEMLALPKYGCLNLHPSLLPRYRGAAPVNWALINGETRTGLSIIQMNERLDAGDILMQEEVDILPQENAGNLESRLSRQGAELMVRCLAELAAGRVHPRPQDETRATLAPKLKPSDGRVDWSLPSQRIINLIRGFTPRPGAYTMFQGRRLEISEAADAAGVGQGGVDHGTMVLCSEKAGPLVKTGDGWVELFRVKPEGRRTMSGQEFARGCRLGTGVKLV